MEIKPHSSKENKYFKPGILTAEAQERNHDLSGTQLPVSALNELISNKSKLLLSISNKS